MCEANERVGILKGSGKEEEVVANEELNGMLVCKKGAECAILQMTEYVGIRWEVLKRDV